MSNPSDDELLNLQWELNRVRQQADKIERRLDKLIQTRSVASPPQKPPETGPPPQETPSLPDEDTILASIVEPTPVMPTSFEPIPAAPTPELPQDIPLAAPLATNYAASMSPSPERASYQSASQHQSRLSRLPSRPPHPPVSLEVSVGKWLTWVAAIVLLIAVGFGLQWAWATFHTPPWVKIAAFHVLGAGLLGAGYWFYRKELPLAAQALAGLGLFTFYASAFAALSLFHVYNSPQAFIECSIVSLVAIAVAVRASSVPIVLIAALGGYLAPIITSSGSGDHVAWFGYLACLNLALVGSAVWRGWSFLKPLTLIATGLMFALWLANGYQPGLRWSTEWLAITHFAVFMLGATIPPWVLKRTSDRFDLAALVASSFGFVGLTWLIFHNLPGQRMALVCWGMAVLHLGMFGVTYWRVTNEDRMPRVQLAIALALITMAVPLQLDDFSYLGVTWTLEALIFFAVGLYFRDRQMLVSALCVFVIATVRLLGNDFSGRKHPLGPWALDQGLLLMGTAALLFAGAGVLAWWIPRRGQIEVQPSRGERRMGAALLAVANVLFLLALARQWQGRELLVMWSTDVVLLWCVAYLRRINALYDYATAIAVVMVGGLAIYLYEGGTQSFLFNGCFGSLLYLGTAFIVAGWPYFRRSQRDNTDLNDLVMQVAWVLPALGIFAVYAGVSFEIRDSYPGSNGQWLGDLHSQSTYSIVWSHLAMAIVTIGLATRYPMLRVLGLVGLAPAAFAAFLTMTTSDTQNTLPYLGLIWTAEAAVFFAIGHYFRDRAVQIAAIGWFTVATVRLLRDDLTAPPYALGGLGIDRGLLIIGSAALLMAATGALTWWRIRRPGTDRVLTLEEQLIGGGLLGAANIVFLLSLWRQWRGHELLVLWTLDIAAIWWAGFWRKKSAVHNYAAALAVAMAGGLALWLLHGDVHTSLVLNWRFAALALLGLVYIVGGWAYRQRAVANRAEIEDFERGMEWLFAILGAVAIFFALTFEVQDLFQGTGAPLGLISSRAAYSIVWSIFAALLVVAGFAARYPALRILGLLSFIPILIKVLLVDLAFLPPAARVLALVVLGVLLLGVSLLYQKFRVISGELPPPEER